MKLDDKTKIFNTVKLLCIDAFSIQIGRIK